MIKKIILGLFTFLFCLIGIDKVYASTSYILSQYDSDFMKGYYGVYCPYGAVKNDGSLVSDDNGRLKVFYNFLFSGGDMNAVFEFGGGYRTIEEELGIAIEAGRPGRVFSDNNMINWLTETGLISSDGKWSCPDLDDPEDKNGDGYTKYRSFTMADGSGSTCKGGNNSCVVSSIPVNDKKTNYTCTYKGQKSGKTITINVFENNEGEIVRNVTYPDGIMQTKNFEIVSDEECSEDIYYVYEERLIKFSTFANDKVSNNKALFYLCSKYEENQIEHFCSGDCNYEEMTCADVTNSISSGSESGSGSSNSNPDGCYGLLPIVKFIRRGIFSIIQIGVPILLIIMGTIDLAKAVMSSDDQEIKKATGKFVKRVIYAIALFFVVTIVTLIMNLVADNTTEENENANKDWRDCWDAAG